MTEEANSFRHGNCYSNPYSTLESRRILATIDEVDRDLNIRHKLRDKGIPQFCKNYRHLMYQWSPYGKFDEPQYKFENAPTTQTETPHRPTR